jgi:hypothetical protein
MARKKNKKLTKAQELMAMTLILDACATLGWNVSFKGGDVDDIYYLLIGTPPAVKKLLKKIEA